MHGEVTSKSQLGFKLSDSSTFILNSWLDKTKYKFQTAWIYQLPKSVFTVSTLYIKSNYLSVPVLDNAEVSTWLNSQTHIFTLTTVVQHVPFFTGSTSQNWTHFRVKKVFNTATFLCPSHSSKTNADFYFQLYKHLSRFYTLYMYGQNSLSTTIYLELHTPQAYK